MTKYQGKSLLPFEDTNTKLKKFCIDGSNWKWALKI